MKKSEIVNLDVELIDEPDEVLRTSISEDGINELADSIQRYGQLSPILVSPKNGRYVIIAGHRRFLATKKLDGCKIDCVIWDGKDTERYFLSVAENLIREDLSPIDEAKIIQKMVEVDRLGTDKISRLLSKKQRWVEDRLNILTWHIQLIEAIDRKNIPINVGKELNRIKDINDMLYYLECAVKSGVSSTVANMWASQWELSQTVSKPGGNAAVGEPGQVISMVVKVRCFNCDDKVPIETTHYERFCPVCHAQIITLKKQEAVEA